MRKRKLGDIVETKTGKTGKVYRDEKKVKGKVVVHVEGDELPLLCDPKTLTIIGNFD